MEKENREVRCVRDFYLWDRLLELGHRVVDLNKDKRFICPILGEKCTYKSVVYFEVNESLDSDIKRIYDELEDSKRG